jgi:hypothetical protein
MRRYTSHRLQLLVAVGVVAAITGGIAYAAIPTTTTGVINGCYENRLGILRVIDAEAGKTCTKYETPISWNQKGVKGDQGLEGAAGTDGADGTSVNSDALAAGDPNCAQGGSKFTASNGVTYACNGAPGQDGEPGADGAQGPPGAAGADFTGAAAGGDLVGTYPNPSIGEGVISLDQLSFDPALDAELRDEAARRASEDAIVRAIANQLAQGLSAHQTRLDDNQNRITALSSQINCGSFGGGGAICDELAALRSAVSSLQALNTEVTSLQEAVSVLQADVAEIRAQLDPKG